MIVSDIAGTTRDATDSYVENKYGKFVFIDTAGLRRKSRVYDSIEKYSVIRARMAVERAQVCVIMIDAVEGFTEQDSKVAGIAHELGKACIIAVNKWDIAQKETELVISKSQGEIEQIEQFEKYITFTLLLPIEANLKEIFNSIIDECNTYGNFLSENIIITNVKKLSTKEIEDFLETKSPPKHKSRPF